ncbi:hypothetical protein J437_LFUL012592 [Ladona fulva]|uniref:Phospholipase B1, membrane-associated n=1 Tax=Ladona fulva TaxID=123851 RepID=A0A8K0P4U7_LADFU|nr:hypothetical protein J437_LFUL012592 [Ladona fulva]
MATEEFARHGYELLSRKVAGWVVGAYIWILVFANGVSAGVPRGRAIDQSSSHQSIARWFYTTESIESIAEEVSSYTYPPDDFHKVVQKRKPKYLPFPCDNVPNKPKWRSDSRPTSVHKLHPGDIDVIAAMGDSLTAANVAREFSPLGLLIQDRGVSFSGGGAASWHEFTTLPNIIKMFNPNLTGYAIGSGDFNSHNAQLNVAIAAANDEDLFNQVKLFMKKIHQDKKINFKNDWKLLSIMIGHNDLCSKQCYDPKRFSAEAHKKHLQKTLDYLYKYVPRLFVNIISVVDPTISARIPSGIFCDIFRRLACSCLYKSPLLEEGVVQVASQARKFQIAEKELVFSGLYDGREDFTVEWQPFFHVMNAPENYGESEQERLSKLFSSDIPIWTPECFHFNQRGLAIAAIHLWNNMLEPVGNKTVDMDDYMVNEYRCPTEENPYFFTKKNSENFKLKGHQ